MKTTSHAPSRKPIVGLILFVSVLIAAGAACATRFHFFRVNDGHVARGDRWTGEVVFVDIDGNFVGRQSK